MKKDNVKKILDWYFGAGLTCSCGTRNPIGTLNCKKCNQSVTVFPRFISILFFILGISSVPVAFIPGDLWLAIPGLGSLFFSTVHLVMLSLYRSWSTRNLGKISPTSDSNPRDAAASLSVNEKRQPPYGELLSYGVDCPKCNHINPAGKITCEVCGARLFSKRLPIGILIVGIVVGLIGLVYEKKGLYIFGIILFICGALVLAFVRGYNAWASQKLDKSKRDENPQNNKKGGPTPPL